MKDILKDMDSLKSIGRLFKLDDVPLHFEMLMSEERCKGIHRVLVCDHSRSYEEGEIFEIMVITDEYNPIDLRNVT